MSMRPDGDVNILLVDDQPAKLMSYETILRDTGQTLIKASSGREALEHLLKSEIAVLLIDVCMPELDGFQLAAMIREHPRFRKVAIIFISAILLTDVDRLRGYEMGAVDYVPVPVVPDVLRAKVRIFTELYRKSRQLERLNAELERRVAERTAELEQSNRLLRDSEDRRNLALVAGKMGSWDWDINAGDCVWDEAQKQIFGVGPGFRVTPASLSRLVPPEDWKKLVHLLRRARRDGGAHQMEFRIHRDGEIRWCLGTAAASRNALDRVSRISGVTMDITDRKEAEERQLLLAREVDHRAKNALAVVQAIVGLTRADNIKQYTAAVEGRIQALARVHSLLSESRWRGASIAQLVREELAPYRTGNPDRVRISGTNLSLVAAAAQALALVLHELATNAAKYGSLSRQTGSVRVGWELHGEKLDIRWKESGGPAIGGSTSGKFGIRVVKASIESQLGGTVDFDWSPKGLACRISIPHEGTLERPGKEDPSNAVFRAADTEPVKVGLRRRVLLVEDESLIGMMMTQTLVELGYEVVGPFAKVSEAIRAIEREPVDAGILDINLGGENAYPVARVLRSLKVPFVFMTGYGADAISVPYPDARIFQKPVSRELLKSLFLPPANEEAPTESSEFSLPADARSA